MTPRGNRYLATGSLLVLLLSCGACSSRWVFAPGFPPVGGACDCATGAACSDGDVSAKRDCLSAELPQRSGAADPAAALPEQPEPKRQSPNLWPDTPASTAWTGLLEGGPARSSPLAATPMRGGRWPGRTADTRAGADSLLPDGPCDWPAAGSPRRRGRLQAALCEVCIDHRNYYSWPSMGNLLLGVAAGSVLANTSMDQDFRDWYQDDVRSMDTDDFARVCKVFGEGQIFVPTFVSLGLLGAICEDRPLGRATGHFAGRVARGYCVGAPPVLLMQYCLGSSRPCESPHESRFRPFADIDAVSGHSFIGAMPFVTAAKMTDDPCWKGCLYFCSILPAWSRVNDDAHYLSQAYLGWWMAYLAAGAVRQTDQDQKQLSFGPLVAPGTVGLEVVYRR